MRTATKSAANYDQLDLWNRVYSYILCSDLTELTEDHCEHLLGRGMMGEEIEQAGYRSLVPEKMPELERYLARTFGEPRLLDTPGFRPHDDGVRLVNRDGGILVPIRGLVGTRYQTRGIQVRRLANHGPRYVSISGGPGGSIGTPIHIPAATYSALCEPKIGPIRVTEGIIKANLATSRSPIPTIAVPGVSVIGPVLGLFTKRRPERVHIAFDMDRESKKGVQTAIDKLAERLTGERHEVVIEWWNRDHKGVDDALLAGEPIHEKVYSKRVLKGGV